MKKTTFWKSLRFLPCLLFLLVIACLLLCNGETFLNYTKTTLPEGYQGYTQGAEAHLAENLAGKYQLVDLNGAVHKLLGIHTLNERFRLRNGYLASESHFGDITATADNIKALSEFLSQEDIGFLYAYIPAKEHSFDARFPAGYEGRNQHEQLDALAEALDARQINHLDLDRWFSDNGWAMEDIYFRTDHHWLPEAGFAAMRLIMERFSQTEGIVLDTEYLDPDNWTFETYEDWFLGSDGKKTGTVYAGIDDFTYIHPNYPTETYVGRVNPDRTEAGLDPTTVYRPSGIWIEDLYRRDPYGTYLGNNYPYAYIRNELAVNPQRLLIVGDSYRLPTECFLSTQFQEIIHVDMREYKDGSFAALVKQMKPDLVLLMGCVPHFEGVLDFGLDIWEQDFGSKILAEPALELSQLRFEEAGNGFSVVLEDIAAGAYQLTLDNGSLGEQTHELVQFALMDKASGEVVCARYFLTEYKEGQVWLFTVPEEGDYQVVAYHGMPGNTKEKTLVLQGITLCAFES